MNFSGIELEILSDGTDIIGLDTELTSLKFFESINSIPYFMIKINTVNPSSYYNLRDVTFKVRTEYSTYSYEGCITKYQLGTGDNILFGYLVPFKHLSERSSSFLGTSIVSAIDSLGIRPSVGGLKEVSGEYYQINETKIEAFLRIMLSSEYRTVFSINRDSIVSFRLDDQSNPNNIVIGSQSVQLEARRFYNFENDSNIDNASDSANNVNWRGVNYPILPSRSIVSPSMGFNIINNRKLTNEINILLDKSFNYYVDFQVGDTMKVVDLELPTQYYKVIQREVEFMDYDLLINLRLGAEGVW